MTHNQEKGWSMEANPGMAEIRELAEKDFKPDVMNIYKERKIGME